MFLNCWMKGLQAPVPPPSRQLDPAWPCRYTGHHDKLGTDLGNDARSERHEQDKGETDAAFARLIGFRARGFHYFVCPVLPRDRTKPVGAKESGHLAIQRGGEVSSKTI